MILSDSVIIETLGRYGVNAKSTLCDSIRTYCELLLRWNRRIALTTVTDPREILSFHFGESMAAVPTIPLAIGRLADVGTGPGFPGIPIKLAAPELSLILIESNAKKAAFLSEVVRELRLDAVEVVRSRFEDVSGSTCDFDFVVTRALGQYQQLLQWSKGRLKATGRVVFWLGENEAASLAKDISWIWGPPTKIGGSERRLVLSGSPSLAPPTGK